MILILIFTLKYLYSSHSIMSYSKLFIILIFTPQILILYYNLLFSVICNYHSYYYYYKGNIKYEFLYISPIVSDSTVMNVCPASTLDLINDIDANFDKFNIHAKYSPFNLYSIIENNIHNNVCKKIFHSIDILLHNIVFLPLYTIISILFLPLESNNIKNFTNLEKFENYAYCNNLGHNKISLACFNIFLLFLNITLGYYILLFVFVVNSPLSMYQIRGTRMASIRFDYTYFYDMQKRYLRIERTTFKNLIKNV